MDAPCVTALNIISRRTAAANIMSSAPKNTQIMLLAPAYSWFTVIKKYTQKGIAITDVQMITRRIAQ